MNMEQYSGNKNMIFDESGQSIIDILIGITIVTLVVGLSTILVFGGQSILIDRGNVSEARALTQEGIDGAKSIVKQNWSMVVDGTYGLKVTNGIWSFVSSSDLTSIYTRTVSVQTVSTNTRKIESRVTWNPTPDRPLDVVYTTLVTNWEVAADTGGDTGGGPPSGDWLNPTTLCSTDLGPGNSATGLDIRNSFLYVTTVASASPKPDFHVLDATHVRDCPAPTSTPFAVLSSINTGDGLHAIDVAGDYAFVANSSITAQLQVIDVSNNANPFVAAYLALPGVSGNGAIGNSIFYYRNYIFIGTRQATGPEFHIIDVNSPASPVWKGSIEIDAHVHKIFVKDNLAYLATSDNNAELLIYDVSDPTNITLKGLYDAVGNDDALSLSLQGNLLYLGRGSGTNNFIILNVTDPTAVSLVSTTNVTTNGLYDILAKDYLIFIGAGDSNKEFQVWNIVSSTAPTFWSSFNYPQVVSDIDYEDNLVFVSVRSNDAVRVITSQ